MEPGLRKVCVTGCQGSSEGGIGRLGEVGEVGIASGGLVDIPSGYLT